jgi:uncharacterized protein DUF4331
MANPLVNELIITTPFKDRWNAAEPKDEANFQAFYKNPMVATELNLVFGVPIVPIDGSPAANRTDLMSILLKYPSQALNGSNCGPPCAELLRLDLRVPPTAPENQSRLGAALSADKAGWPNGRRPNDDVHRYRDPRRRREELYRQSRRRRTGNCRCGHHSKWHR